MRPTRPITVLIADDHPIFRRGLCDIIAGDSSLRLVGEAADGEQAWRLIQKLQPAVAVLDVHMPKRSGIQLGRLLSRQRLPVELIILTMDAEEALLNEALNLGVKGYLLKETAVTDLLKAIHRVAGGDCYISPALSGALLRRNAAPVVAQSLAEPGRERCRVEPMRRQNVGQGGSTSTGCRTTSSR